MSESIKAIKWCSAISMLFLVFTYIVTVNSEGHFITFNSIWISSSFFITLFGGVFASMLVVVLCELQKYLTIKNNTELFLFYQSVNLYYSLMQMQVFIEEYLNNQECQISDNLFDESISLIQSEMNALQTTEYTTFKNNNKSLMVEHRTFCNVSLPTIRPILQCGIQLRIAIKETRIDFLQTQMESKTYFPSYNLISSKSPRVSQLLNNLNRIVASSVSLVDDYIFLLDHYCNNKFKWNEKREQLNYLHIEDFKI